MADDKPMTATLELVYVPDTYTETERQEGASWPLGSGYYDLVAVVDGAPLPVHRFKAGAVDKQFALAKQRKEEQSSKVKPAPPASEPAPPQVTTTEAPTPQPAPPASEPAPPQE